jgi:hypothetical protein
LIVGNPTAAAWVLAAGFGECPSCEDRMPAITPTAAQV